jgi:hypothetical protein
VIRDERLKIGTRFCKCSACGRYFGGVSGFDMHRIGGKCVDPAAILDKHNRRKLWLDDRGYWVGEYKEAV